MPENLYFCQPQTQDILLNILFIWAKLNEDVSYRQGMHEILAPILWVVERDAVDSDQHGTLAATVFDSTYVTHDTFTLFSLVMQYHKLSYAVAPPRSTANSRTKLVAAETESPMIGRSMLIMNTMLAKADPELATHLQKADIVPQVFLMRWIRLLFGREFSFDHSLELWDWLFAMSPSLDCVDLICVVMLLRIRWKLIETDTDHVLSVLLRYPDLTAVGPLVVDALYLRDHLNPAGGAHIIAKYSSRSPSVARVTSPTQSLIESRLQAVDHASPQRTFSPFATSSRILQESGGIETVLQDVARGVYLRGEKWGVNKAMRDAVGEVRKNVQTLQSRGSTPVGPRPTVSQGSVQRLGDSDTVTDLSNRLDELMARNKSLAKMLQSATDNLWKRQEETPANDDNTRLFTMAVASVQLVQVYLEDSSLQLPPEEAIASSEHTDDATDSTSLSAQRALPVTERGKHERTTLLEPERSTRPDRSKVESRHPIPEQTLSQIGPGQKRTVQPQSGTDIANSSPVVVNSPTDTKATSRPSLQSSYSWMLGQAGTTEGTPRSQTSSGSLFGESTYATSSPYSTSLPTRKKNAHPRTVAETRPSARINAGFLFGDADDLAPAAASGLGFHIEPEENPKRTDSKARRTVSKMLDETEDGDDIFRLGTMKQSGT